MTTRRTLLAAAFAAPALGAADRAQETMRVSDAKTASPSTATLAQKRSEALALRLAEAPEVRAAREEARRIFLDNPYAQTTDGRASLEDAAAQHFHGALHLVTNTDPHHPEVVSVFLYEHDTDGQRFPASLHGGLENPDNVYRIIPIAFDSRYELHGVRHAPAPAQVTYELMDSIPALRGIGEQIALLMDRDMQVGPDGGFTITLDPDPANGRPNHIQTTPEARALFIRDTMSDWTAQAADTLRVARTAGPSKPPRSERELAQEAAWLVVQYARFWNEFRDGYVKKLAFKTNQFDPPAKRTGGWGFIANTHFRIAGDEAYVFTAHPGLAPYHAVLIGNHWWITMDAARRSGAFNTSQAQTNRDGTITYVIAARDPGVWNWLDTGGLHEGIIQVRWQGGDPGETALSGAIRDAALMKLSDLKQRLPAETVWLTPAEREAQLAARHESYCRRLSPA